LIPGKSEDMADTLPSTTDMRGEMELSLRSPAGAAAVVASWLTRQLSAPLGCGRGSDRTGPLTSCRTACTVLEKGLVSGQLILGQSLVARELILGQGLTAGQLILEQGLLLGLWTLEQVVSYGRLADTLEL
jgi:hypothetical protein